MIVKCLPYWDVQLLQDNSFLQDSCDFANHGNVFDENSLIRLVFDFRCRFTKRVSVREEAMDRSSFRKGHRNEEIILLHKILRLPIFNTFNFSYCIVR